MNCADTGLNISFDIDMIEVNLWVNVKKEKIYSILN
jgi:hypothetical protein